VYFRVSSRQVRGPVRFCAHLFLVALGVIAGASASLPRAQAQGFETAAKQAVLIESETGAVLFAKNADQLFPPASMALLMTLEVVFDALKKGELTQDQTIAISEYAWRTGGAPAGRTTMFAKLKSEVPVIDLIRGVIVHIAYDGAIALAEGLSGSEQAFTERMNVRATELGLRRSRFTNPMGYEDERMNVTAREMAELANHIIKTYPQFYPMFSQPDFTWNDIYQRNKNSLIEGNFGIDGLMVGGASIKELGAVASAVKDGRRLILAFYGLPSKKEREKQAKALFEWGFSSFGDVQLFAAGETVGEVRVFGGEETYVPVVGRGAVKAYLPLATRKGYKARVVYRGPIPAPVKEGDEIAHLEVTHEGAIVQNIPLYAAKSMPVGDFGDKARDGLIEALAGLWY